jgi:hypothetical protein
VEHGIGDRLRPRQVEAAALDDLVRRVDDVAQHRKEQFLGALDHLAVHESRSRRVADLEFHAEGMAQDADVEVAIAVEDFARIVGVAAGIEHGERALAEERIQSALSGGEQLPDLVLRQALERAARRHASIDDFRDDDTGFHLILHADGQGRMLIGVPSATSIQTSIMSALLSAMQPSVQSSRA